MTPPTETAAALLTEAEAAKATAFRLHLNGDVSHADRAQATTDALRLQARLAPALSQALADVATLIRAFDAAVAASNRLTLVPGMPAPRTPLEQTLPVGLLVTAQRELAAAHPAITARAA